MTTAHTYRATNIKPFTMVLLAIGLANLIRIFMQQGHGWFLIIAMVFIAVVMLINVSILLTRVTVDGQGIRFTLFGRPAALRSLRWDEVSLIEYGGRPGKKGRFFKACLAGRRPVFIPVIDNAGKVIFSRIPQGSGGADTLSLEQAVREACGHGIAEVENLFAAPARQG